MSRTTTSTPLAAAIASRGLKHGFLAEMLGLSKSAFSRLVRGERAVRRAEAIVLADVLGVGVEELLGNGGDE